MGEETSETNAFLRAAEYIKVKENISDDTRKVPIRQVK